MCLQINIICVMWLTTPDGLWLRHLFKVYFTNKFVTVHFTEKKGKNMTEKGRERLSTCPLEKKLGRYFMALLRKQAMFW